MAQTEIIQGHVEEVSNDLQLRQSDVVGAAEVGNPLLAFLEHQLHQSFFLFLIQTVIEVLNEFYVEHSLLFV